MKKTLLPISIAILIATGASAQKMSGTLRLQLREMQEKQSNVASISSEQNAEHIHVIIQTDDPAAAAAAVKAHGGSVQGNGLSNIMSVSLPVSQLEEFSNEPSIEYIDGGKTYRRLMNLARDEGNVTRCQSTDLTTNNFKGYTGKGVVIGIIDGGFDFGHRNFLSRDGKQLRIKRVWSQKDKTGTPPEGYDYGTEYTDSAVIVNLPTDDPYSQHGSHVAGIAAGADVTSGYYGVAPDADLIFVSCPGTDSGVLDGLKYIQEYAKSVNKPCAINISMGSHLGPHDGTSTIDRGLGEYTGEGCIIVCSAGNEGDQNIHASKVLTEDEKTMYMFFMNNEDGAQNLPKSGDRTLKSYLTVWGGAGKNLNTYVEIVDKEKVESGEDGIMAISPVAYAIPSTTTEKDTATYKFSINNVYPFNGESNAESGILQGEISIGAGVSKTNNKPYAYVTAKMQPTCNLSRYDICVCATGTPGDTLNAWTEDPQSVSYIYKGCYSDGTDGDKECTIGELGGTSKYNISVGAYITRNSYKNIDGGEKSNGYTIGQMAGFSSVGPTIDGRMKPEVAAPGGYIFSSVGDREGRANIIDIIEEYGRKNYYAASQGTSMSSPFVAGTVALWLQANPKLTLDDVREVLKKTCRIDEAFRNNPLGEKVYGYGKIDAYTGLQYIQSQITGITETAFADETLAVYVDRAEKQVTVCYPEDTCATACIDIYNTLGQKVASQNIAHSGQNAAFTSLPDGIYTICVKHAANVKTVKTFM